MAIQDDIIAMLSQVSDAGDRATDRGRRGEELYKDIANRLSGDNRSKAMREIAMLSGNPEMSIEEQMRFDPLTGSRVADIIEKYMDDAGDGVPAAVPDDMIVDDTRAAERMMEVMPSPGTAPRTPVTIEELQPLPPMPGAGPGEAGMLMVDDTGSAMQGQGMDQIREKIMSAPRIQEAMIQESMDGARSNPGRAADLQEMAIREMEETARKQGVYGTQGARLRAAAGEETGLSGALLAGRMGREATPEDEANSISALVYGGIPIGGIAALTAGGLARIATRLGIGRFSPQQIARNPQLRLQIEQEVRLALPKPTPGAPSSYVNPSAQVGGQAREAAQAAARARQAAAARARQAARGERSGPDIPITPSPAQRLGSTQGSTSAFDDLINRLGPIGMARGMSVRDNILRNYAMMADGGYVATGEQGNYNENVVQQMRRLKREFGTDEAVDLMREMYPEYRIGNSGLIMGKPKRSNDDSFPVPNAPLELLRNYLRDK
jgi:hypothetical protein